MTVKHTFLKKIILFCFSFPLFFTVVVHVKHYIAPVKHC